MTHASLKGMKREMKNGECKMKKAPYTCVDRKAFRLTREPTIEEWQTLKDLGHEEVFYGETYIKTYTDWVSGDCYKVIRRQLVNSAGDTVGFEPITKLGWL